MTIHLRNKIIIIILSLFVSSCSEDSSETNEKNTNEFELTTDLVNFKYGVDEKISFNINSNDTIQQVCVEIGNFSEKIGTKSICKSNLEFESTILVNISLSTQGMRTLKISATNLKNQTSELEYEIEIDSQNTLQIKRIVINSFNGIGETNDPEFSEMDSNRLADLIFVLKKRVIALNINENNLSDTDWLISEIIENEGDKTWDLSNKGLILGVDAKFKFFLYDADGLTDTNLIGSNGFVQFDFSEFKSTRPNEVVFKKEDLGFEMVFEVNWN